MREAVKVSEKSPVLLDRFLDDAIEVDVDCISDGNAVMIGGIMEHVEQAGIHSGDSACSRTPRASTLSTACSGVSGSAARAPAARRRKIGIFMGRCGSRVAAFFKPAAE